MINDLKTIINYIDDITKKFNCDVVYIGLDDGINNTVYLITGDFIPFLFSNNKIYSVSTCAIYEYYNNKYKGCILCLYEIQEQKKQQQQQKEEI